MYELNLKMSYINVNFTMWFGLTLTENKEKKWEKYKRGNDLSQVLTERDDQWKYRQTLF